MATLLLPVLVGTDLRKWLKAFGVFNQDWVLIYSFIEEMVVDGCSEPSILKTVLSVGELRLESVFPKCFWKLKLMSYDTSAQNA